MRQVERERGMEELQAQAEMETHTRNTDSARMKVSANFSHPQNAVFSLQYSHHFQQELEGRSHHITHHSNPQLPWIHVFPVFML